jgi:hypothetical protein
MPGICTTVMSPHACGHKTVTVTIDGVTVSVPLHDDDDVTPLTNEELEQFVRLGIRRLRAQGVTLAQMLNRITNGDEATNVKQYDFFGPGAAIAKTNIGVAYVNICPGLNGERLVVDLTGCTEFRVIMHANLVGTGQFGARIVRDGDNAILYENTNLGVAGERELDTNWQTLPVAFQGQELTVLRAQAKSATAADDPVFRGCRVGLR